MFFKICASISEVQLKKCKVGIFPLTLRYDVCDSDDCRVTLADYFDGSIIGNYKKSCINMKLFLYLLHYENGYIKYDQVTA